MKHLLNGVAIAAALAIAVPAWAQAPMTPKTSAPNAAATASAPAAPMASKQRHHRRGAKRMARARRGGAASMTDQLNREELARIQSGGPPPMPPAGVSGQPSQQQGIPGAGQPSASYHPVPQ